MLPLTDLKKIILSEDLIKETGLDKAILDSSKADIDLEEFLIEKKLITEEKLYRSAAKYFDLDFVSFLPGMKK